MSLITDHLLKNLWDTVQAKPSEEWASVDLWGYLWYKHLFTEKEWLISSETPPEGSGRRRVDITIRYLGMGNKRAVLAFHEAKALNAGPQRVQEAEAQAFDACMRYLGEHPEFKFVYAFTSFGSKGRAWRCSRIDDYLFPLFGSDELAERDQYVELHSSEAGLIRQAVQKMKDEPPY